MMDEKPSTRNLFHGVQLPLSACGMRGKGSKRSSVTGKGASNSKANGNGIGSGKDSLMMKVVADENIRKAIKHVKGNKGSPGVDSMGVNEIEVHFSRHWESIKGRLLAGTYVPFSILRVEIPKPGKKEKRKLGIPTVQDRVIQQAILQVIQELFDPYFSDHSFGFRPGRSAHDALQRAKEYVRDGYQWVVDIDLEKFFDQVNHGMLMSRLSRKVPDKALRKVIRRYLKAGILENGVVIRNEEGTPQGGPLSPLLSNILLDDLDKELERRGHKFVRYADDCNVYVRSDKAAGRVLESTTSFIEKHLKLRVNRDKSTAGLTGLKRFLGFRIHKREDSSAKLGFCPQRLKDFRTKVKILLKHCRGSNVKWFIEKRLNVVLRGWLNYFRITDWGTDFKRLDSWIRHRLRAIYWRQWKRPRTRIRKLTSLGMKRSTACKVVLRSAGPWRSSMHICFNTAMNPSYFRDLGLLSLHQKWEEYRKAQ